MEGGELIHYFDILSQPARAVKAVLLMGNIPHKEVAINLLMQENKTEEFLKLYPRGLLPVIVHGDFVLGESNAILKYLCETFPTIPSTLWPTDAKERARVDQYLEWYQNHLRPGIVGYIKARL